MKALLNMAYQVVGPAEGCLGADGENATSGRK